MASVSRGFSSAAELRRASALAEQSACEIRVLQFLARVSGPARVVERLQALNPGRADWPGRRGPERIVTFSITGPASLNAGWYGVTRDGAPAWKTKHLGQVFSYLIWTITNMALDSLKQDYLLFHGGAVALGDRGVILPAASRSGKTTLTAGLVAHGFQYYSDDVVVLESDTLRLVPFAKSMCIKPGSRHVLAPLYPELLESVPRVRFDRECVWYLPPPAEARAKGSVPVNYIVLPRYARGEETVLKPIERSEAVRRFFEQSFNLGAHGPAGAAALAALLEGADCYTLTVGNLQAGVDAVRRLVH
jgi:hypothetical protein